MIAFLRRRYPYLLGIVVIEAGIYYFNGPAGDTLTGFAGLFSVWVFYGLMSRQ